MVKAAAVDRKWRVAMELMHANCRLVSVLFEKNQESMFIGQKNRNAPECKISRHKIKNVLYSEKRPDFEEKIDINDFFQQVSGI